MTRRFDYLPRIVGVVLNDNDVSKSFHELKPFTSLPMVTEAIAKQCELNVLYYDPAVDFATLVALSKVACFLEAIWVLASFGAPLG